MGCAFGKRGSTFIAEHRGVLSFWGVVSKRGVAFVNPSREKAEIHNPTNAAEGAREQVGEAPTDVTPAKREAMEAKATENDEQDPCLGWLNGRSSRDRGRGDESAAAPAAEGGMGRLLHTAMRTKGCHDKRLPFRWP